jgi:type IX secretion system PorP/SprF family membrane protein
VEIIPQDINMNKHSVGVILLTLMLTAQAQNEPFFSQHMFGGMAINPGASGANDLVCLTALARQQWVKFAGSPELFYGNINAPFNLFKLSHGVAFTVKTETFGFENRGFFNLAYAYRHAVGNGKLGIGMNVGILNNTLEATWKYPGTVGNSGMGLTSGTGGQDPAIPNASKESATIFDMGLGVFYKSDKIYMGISSTHINQPQIKFESGNPYLNRHIYIVGGYNLKVPNTDLSLQPSFLIGSDFITNQLVVSAIANYKQKFWGGLSHRYGSAIIGIIGFELFKDVEVGYSYDFETSKIRSYSSGSHEIMLRYSFDMSREKFPEQYRSIRYL